MQGGEISELAVAAPSPTIDPRTPAPPPTAAAQRGADGEILPDIVASGVVVATSCLVAPAGEAFTVNIDNQDAGTPHNFDLMTSTRGGDQIGEPTVRARSAVQQTFDSPALARYFFLCDVHPTTMTGTLVAIEAVEPAFAGCVRRPATTQVTLTRPVAGDTPDLPGAYLFRDGDGRVVYVGKARSLRKRLANYWGKPLHPRTEAMVQAAEGVEWIVAGGEVDALMLEYNLIQRHRPRFNIRYRDDKSYPYLALTVGGGVAARPGAPGGEAEECPLLRPVRARVGDPRHARCADSCVPRPHVHERVLRPAGRAKRPCLYFDIGRCSGPCVPEVSGVTLESYRADVDALADFLSGNTRPVMQRLDRQMREVAERQEYEQAAKPVTSSAPRAGPSSRRRWCSTVPRTSM